jgi:ankyrin repeat protein
MLADENFATRQAGHNDDIEVMRKLTMGGADVNGTSADGWTTLHEAPRAGHFRLIITFLDDLNATSEDHQR